MTYVKKILKKKIKYQDKQYKILNYTNYVKILTYGYLN